MGLRAEKHQLAHYLWSRWLGGSDDRSFCSCYPVGKTKLRARELKAPEVLAFLDSQHCGRRRFERALPVVAADLES